MDQLCGFQVARVQCCEQIRVGQQGRHCFRHWPFVLKIPEGVQNFYVAFHVRAQPVFRHQFGEIFLALLLVEVNGDCLWPQVWLTFIANQEGS